MSDPESDDANANPVIDRLVDRLRACLRDGTVLDLNGGLIPADLIRDALLGKEISGRVVAAAGTRPLPVARRLLTVRPQEEEPGTRFTEVDPRGLSIRCAVIDGRLDLKNADIKIPVNITNSRIPDGVTLHGAKLGHSFKLVGCTVDTIDLTEARIAGEVVLSGARVTRFDLDGRSFVGDGLQTGSDMLLDKGFTTEGSVHLTAARITGVLRMDGAKLGGDKKGCSLVGTRLQVNSMFLNGNGPSEDSFTAAGAVYLISARVIGQLGMRYAHLGADKEGKSLVGDGLQVEGSMLLDGFTTTGAVHLPVAHITGRMSMCCAHLGADKNGASLVGDGLQVEGSMLLDESTTTGAVHLPGAHIATRLSIRRAELGADKEGASLVGDGLKVDDSMLLDESTTTGAVHLPGAHIARKLAIQTSGLMAGPTSSPGLILAGTTVDELRLDLRDPKREAGRKPKNKQVPPERVVLSLENCTYKHRPDPDLGSLETWLRILRFHTPDYEPRSYQQLAAAHRAAGHERDAGRILMAQQDHRRATVLRPKDEAKKLDMAGLWISRAGLGIWKVTLGYGYRPRLALARLLGLLAIAIALVATALLWPTTPEGPVAYRPVNPDTGTPIGPCSLGGAAGLAVRIAIPLVTNLGQGACIINTASIPAAG